MTTKKGRVETRGEERQELLQNYMMYKVHWLHELFKGLTVSQQRYFYLSFQINDASKCTEKSYQIFLTFNSHMYSRDTNLWRPKIWRLSFLSLPAPPPPLPWPSPQWEWFRTFYEVVHEVHTIKFAIIVFMPERKWLNTCKNAPETVL